MRVYIGNPFCELTADSNHDIFIQCRAYFDRKEDILIFRDRAF